MPGSTTRRPELRRRRLLGLAALAFWLAVRAFEPHPTVYGALVKLQAATDSQAVAAWQHTPGVAYAEPNYTVETAAIPNDPRFTSLYALNNTGQAIEIIAMTLAVYLVIGLAVSAVMNWYNARIALVTR